MNSVKKISLIIKWGRKEYTIENLTDQDTVAVLRRKIFRRTKVRPERQKLLNLKYKGEMAADSLKLGSLELKPNCKIMMIGSTEADVRKGCLAMNFFQYALLEEMEQEQEGIVKSLWLYASLLERVINYPICQLNPPRPDKKLFVLGIDHTLFGHRSIAKINAERMRPFVHLFLTIVYEYYDIVIWSDAGTLWTLEAARLLGVFHHTSYKILCYLDSNAMITARTYSGRPVQVKPLAFLLLKYSQYSSDNSIMFDDVRRNLLMNPQCGLCIRPFRHAILSRVARRELLQLSEYLTDIAVHCSNFRRLDHSKWRDY